MTTTTSPAKAEAPRGSDAFYARRTARAGRLGDLLRDGSAFAEVPDDWAVVMLDVAGSTHAVAAGLHQEVNLAATGGIAAVLNALRRAHPGLKVPYFFGGDGATFLAPEHTLDLLLDTLDDYRLHVKRGIELTLKTGAHSVGGLRAAGHTLRLARWRVNAVLTLPVILGSGLKAGERAIKAALDPHDDQRAAEAIAEALDLTGVECRWDEIAPPARRERVVCLVVTCADEARQAGVYGELADALDAALGPHAERQPVSRSMLKLDLAVAKIRAEMRARLGRYDPVYLAREWFLTLCGPLWFRYTASGRAYLEQVAALSHTLMLDGTFNCVLAGSAGQVARLRAHLDAAEARGDLRYGLHETRAAVMSCYVVDRDRDHAHFVDGTEGGYTLAATALKRKLAQATA